VLPSEAEGDHEASKQQVGEHIYSYIAKVQPTLAGKITGMLIESLEIRELFMMVQTPAILDGKINEALAVLQSQPAKDGSAEAQVVA